MSTLSPNAKGYILTLSCPNRPGIVAALSQTLYEAGANITEAQQYDDVGSGSFFMRIMFDIVKGKTTEAEVRVLVDAMAGEFGMDYRLNCQSYRPKVVIMVSKFDHCLVDLLYRWRIGELPIEPVGIIANHTEETYKDIDFYGIPFTICQSPRTRRPGRRPVFLPWWRKAVPIWSCSRAICRFTPTTWRRLFQAGALTSTIPSCPVSRVHALTIRLMNAA